MFSFENLPMTFTVALVIVAWLLFISIVVAAFN